MRQTIDDIRSCEKFETNENKSYAISDKNGYWYDKDGKPVKNQKKLEQIVSAKKEYHGSFEHELWKNKIFVVNGEYYVTFMYNVNWQTPYGLFKYNKEKNLLKEIFYISNEKITGLKF